MSWPMSLSPVGTVRISSNKEDCGERPLKEQWSKYLDLLESSLGQKVLGGFDSMEG